MQQEKMRQLLIEKKEYLFDNGEIDEGIVAALVGVGDDCFESLQKIPLRNPSLIQILAVLPCSFDRLLLGDVVKMVLKSLTLGGLGIWWITDIFSAKSRCCAYNRKTFLKAVNDPSYVKEMIDSQAKMAAATDFILKVGPSVIDGARGIRDTMYIK